MGDTRWQDIYEHLRKEGFDVYSPSQKTDECKEPYVVIKDSGMTGVVGVSSNVQSYDIMVYVPKNKYSMLEVYVKSVKTSLKQLFPMIRPEPFQTPSFYDDTVKAHMVSMKYLNYQKRVR